MRKCYNLFIFFCLIGLVAVANENNDPKTLCVQIISQSKDGKQVIKIIDVIKKYPAIFKYIPSIVPIATKNKPRISSNYGKRFHPVDKKESFHSGIDFVAEFATSIHATAEGKVIFSGEKSGYGKCIIIEHQYGFQTLYGHQTELYVEKGEKVKKGSIIGFLGNTGKSTGAHLHYEVIKNGSKIDPKDFLNL